MSGTPAPPDELLKLLTLSDVWIGEYSSLFPQESSRLRKPDFEWLLSARHFRDKVAFRRFLLGSEAPAWGKALAGPLTGSESGAPTQEELDAANTCASRFCKWANARDLRADEPFKEDPAAADATAPADPSQPAAPESQLKKNLRILTSFWWTLFYALEEPEEARRSALREFAHEVKPAALCLSGGGIRSATFALGLLQRMAQEDRLLSSFHYLSTVSGGGYIGAWLSSWIFRQGQVAGGDMAAGISQVADLLGHVHSATSSADHHSSFGPEPTPVRHLRIFSNYLTPRVGLFSADTWTVAATFVRNMLLNWLVIVPLLMLGLLVPRVVAAYTSWVGAQLVQRPDSETLRLILPGGLASAVTLKYEVASSLSVLRLSAWAEMQTAVALLLLTYALAFITLHRPSLAAPREKAPAESDADRKKREKTTGLGAFICHCILPTFFGVNLLSVDCVWQHVVTSNGVGLPGWFVHFKTWLPFGAEPLWVRFALCGALIAALAKLVTVPRFVASAKSRRGGGTIPSWFALAWEYLKEMGALVLIFAAMGGVCPSLCERMDALCSSAPLLGKNFNALVTCAGPGVGFMVIFLFMNLQVGLVSGSTSDQDREWFSRASAWALLTAVVWVFISFLVLWAPYLIEDALKAITPVAAFSAIVTALGSFHSLTPVNNDSASGAKTSGTSKILNLVLGLAAPVFVISTIILLSCLTNVFLLKLNGEDLRMGQHFSVVEGRYYVPLAILAVLLGVVSLAASRFVNINMFSLHAMYRSRLIRAYLGASREVRRPNIFTGFDPEDNLCISRLNKAPRLFHVVNATLNLVTSKNLAWQERKATSFTMTPLTCGNINLGYRDSARYAVGTDKEPLTLGGAITISGAAANPNMGYHSSPALTFLMTLFNARLGVWLGNTGPAGKDTFQRDSPKMSAVPLVAEAFGFTDEEHPYINLSDGGHFENLGLYEMVLRRCHFIVVSDAGCDPEYTFEDLGNAVSKIRVDLGIPIVFQDIEINRFDPTVKPPAGRYCAMGRIEYSKVDGPNAQDGKLIYFKPAICGSEPADVFHYARQNEAFPHEPTSDQWFGESQFESYRMLGYHALDSVYRTAISPMPGELALEELTRHALGHLA